MNIQNAIDWLLDSDPAIRWQALRDLTDASADEIAAERTRITREVLGSQILAAQQPDGSWRRQDARLAHDPLHAPATPRHRH